MCAVQKDTICAFDGIVIPGLGAARGNLAAQLPKIAAEYPSVKDCYAGTINIQLDEPLYIIKPDYKTKLIEWMPGCSEKFNFTVVQFECPIGSQHSVAWIYNPNLSPHRFDDLTVELIAPYLPGVAKGQACRLHLPKNRLGERRRFKRVSWPA
ncbi:MAG TPA: hypothetical protein VFR09_08600 [Alphaproteobacteria bacterium]|nr:hypothetical protein [Alphaproteobacteria bacterium]